MAKKTEKRGDTAVERVADMSDEVLESIETAQRKAIKSVRRFVDTVDDAIPTLGDRSSRREPVLDAALDMADKLVTAQYEFLRTVVRSADRTLGPEAAEIVERLRRRRSSSAGTFEVYTDRAGKYRFRLRDNEGHILAVGEAKETRKACLDGIDSIKKNAGDAPVADAKT